MLKRILAVLSVVATVAAAPAIACPNPAGQPYFGSIQLYAGFQPDPYVRNITAGGPNNLNGCGAPGWAGYVTSRPDFDLYWNGNSSQVTIAIESFADAILLVRSPDGLFTYNDDYIGTNPAITFYNPTPGYYGIWIGSYDGSRRNPGRLIITEYDY
jgi:hypothetical protein